MAYGVHETLVIIYPKPSSIYLKGTVGFRVKIGILGSSMGQP